jgi:hypothetical protein
VLLFSLFILIVLTSRKKTCASKTFVKRTSTTILLAAMLSTLLHSSVLSLSGVQPASKSQSTLGMLAELGYAANYHPESLPEDSLNLVKNISTGDSFAGFKDCRWPVPFYYSPGFNYEYFESQWREIPKAYAQALPTAGGHFLYAHLCRTATFLPPIISNGPGFVSWTILSVWEPNNQGITASSPVPFLKDLVSKWRLAWESRGFLLSWTGLMIVFYFWISAKMQRLAKKDDEFSLKLKLFDSLVLAQWLFLIIFGPSQDSRYAIVIQWLTVCLITLVLYDVMKKRKVNS